MTNSQDTNKQQQEPVAVMTVLHLKDRTEIGYGPASAGYDLPTGEYKLYTSPQPAQQPRYDLLHEYAITNRLDYNGLCRVVRAATERPVQQQKPVAWTSWRELAGARHYGTPGWVMHAHKRSDEDIPLYTSPQPSKPWVGLMRGVRVEGDTVIISVKGGNDNARELCGELLREKNA